MNRVAIDDVDVVTNPMEVHDVRRPVSLALGTEHVAMNYFELAPGARHDWEEIESLIECRTCGEERPHATELTDEGRFRFTCEECGTSFSP